MNQFKGMGVALVTPFKANFEIDYTALEQIVEYNISNGTDYLVVLGTTAESATLSKQEKEEVTKFIISITKNRVPIVLGIGGNNTAAVVEDIKQTDLNGVSAILSVSPYYNKPTQEGIYQHFKAIALATDMPVIIYNVPSRTSSNILPETIARLASDFKNLIGVKEAAGDIVQAMRLLSMLPKEFLVISGDDMVTLPMILAGGSGVISVIGQGLPKLFTDLVKLALDGNANKAYEIQYKLMPIIDLIFKEGNPAGIKAVFESLQMGTAVVRLPLVSASDQLRQEISEALKRIKV